MSPARVLVVDDEDIILLLVCQTLAQKGYEAVPACGALRALEIARSQPPFDVVLSDIIMPGISGVDLVQQLAQGAPNLSVVLMTGGAVDSLAVPPNAAILKKPFLPADLLDAIEGALRKTSKLRTPAPESNGQQESASGRPAREVA